MLKHEDIPQTQTQPAAQVRVTPEELAAAVTAIQIRKEGQSGTIAIGDAVEELGLDVTPEEVLAEVQARQRAAPRKRRSTIYDRVVLALGLGGILLGLAVDGNGLLQMRGEQAASSYTADNSVRLDQVPYEQQVYVNTDGLEQIIGGEAQSQVKVYHTLFPQHEAEDWGVIKHSGKVYVQGYTLRATEETLTTKPVVIMNSEDQASPNSVMPDGSRLSGFDRSGTWYETEKVTLPIKAFHYDDSEQTPEHAQITVSRLHTDNHLWDEFKDHFAR